MKTSGPFCTSNALLLTDLNNFRIPLSWLLWGSFLDEISRRPAATFASQQVDRDAGNAKNQLLKSVANRVGIFFFYKSDDEYSDLQAPLVKMLEQGEGFSIVPVSMDGRPSQVGCSRPTKPIRAMPSDLA